MLRRSLVTLFAAIACVSGSSSAFSQDILTELYGRGVHAYFSGDYPQASELLTQAIDAGSKDPRVFYYRGLTQAAQGATDIAASDFEMGANYEFTGKRAYDVGRALARIQGSSRLTIEKARRQARLVAQTTKAKILNEQYEETTRSDKEVVRQPDAKPPVVETPPPPAANDPFADGAEMKEGEATADPTAPAAPPASGDAEKDPFADDPAAEPATAPPAEDDPFGSDAGAAPAADAPAADAPAADDDPFGDN